MHIFHLLNVSFLIKMKSKLALLVAFAVYTVALQCRDVSANVEKEKRLLKDLFESYDPDFRVGKWGGATNVTISLFLRSIQELDSIAMKWKVQLTFRMQWEDQRLQYDKKHELSDRKSLSVPKSLRKKLWTPDVFFANEIQSNYHDMMERNEYIRLFPDGTVIHSSRISLTLSCPMAFRRYPFDKQTCSIRMASYGFTNQDIIFEWKKEDPVQVTSDLHLQNFVIEQFTTDHCDSQTNTGVYSCLHLDVTFQRDSSWMIFGVFMPMIAGIVMAWLSSFLHPLKFGIGRLILLLFILFFNVFVARQSMQNISNASYSTEMDIWNCCIGIFGLWALLEFIFVNVLANRGVENEDQEVKRFTILEKLHMKKLQEKMSRLKYYEFVDITHRLVYPLAFIYILGSFYCSFTREDIY